MSEVQLSVLASDRDRFVTEQVASGEKAGVAEAEYQRQIFAMARDESERNVVSMPWLPQLPEAWAQEIYDRIEDAERRLAAPNLLGVEYEEGVAETDDQIEVIRRDEHSTGVLLTAEHATGPISWVTGKRRFPDAGTGGLTAAVAEDYGTGLIMVGRQTSNVPSDPDHPLKSVIRQHLSDADGFMSVHGMARGKFMSVTDRTEIQASLGLGINPTEKMCELADKIVQRAKDELGLYVVVGNYDDYFVQKEHSTDLKLNKDGTPYRNRLAALRPNMTTNVARQEIEQQGRSVPAIQVELTKFLRVSAIDSEKRDRVSKVIGVALGYKLLESIIDLCYVEQPPEAGQKK